jgi:hypothetical protein
MMRTCLVVVATVCMTVAAYLTFDSPFDGLDDTCANLFLNRAHEGICGDFKRDRTNEVILLTTGATVLLCAARRHRV